MGHERGWPGECGAVASCIIITTPAHLSLPLPCPQALVGQLDSKTMSEKEKLTLVEVMAPFTYFYCHQVSQLTALPLLFVTLPFHSLCCFQCPGRAPPPWPVLATSQSRHPSHCVHLTKPACPLLHPLPRSLKCCAASPWAWSWCMQGSRQGLGGSTA